MMEYKGYIGRVEFDDEAGLPRQYYAPTPAILGDSTR